MSDAQVIVIAIVGGIVLLALCGVAFYAIRRGCNVSFWGRMGWLGFGGEVNKKRPE